MSEQLQLHFSKTFSGQIWGQHLAGAYLLLSLRDHEKLEASFTLIHLVDGSVVFEDLIFEESWWISVYHFDGTVITFQVHEDSQDIDARSYLAYHIADQEVVWGIDNALAMGRQGAFVQMRNKDDQEDVFWVNSHTGQAYDELPEVSSPESISSEALFPLHYTEESAYFKTVTQFLESKLAMSPQGACDYLEHGGYILLAFHEGQSPMTLRMLVMDDTGKLLMDKTLDTDLKGLVSGAFFIAGERLIFVEGRNTLNSYLIES